MTPNSLQELYVKELKDLYDAEQQISKALPEMIDEASSKDLKAALAEHLEITKTQAMRLAKVPPDKRDTESRKTRDYFEHKRVTTITDDIILSYGRRL
jgi:ferritin-like metal-binding protein YciE